MDIRLENYKELQRQYIRLEEKLAAKTKELEWLNEYNKGIEMHNENLKQQLKALERIIFISMKKAGSYNGINFSFDYDNIDD